MEDIRTVINSHNPKNNKMPSGTSRAKENEFKATTSEIPDLFFDDILIHQKLSRIEILLLMYLYRITWCKPNLYKKYGIAPMVSHSEIAHQLDISMDNFHTTLRSLETFGFIETIRSGQYFVRKYFTLEHDVKYGQTYDNFL